METPGSGREVERCEVGPVCFVVEGHMARWGSAPLPPLPPIQPCRAPAPVSYYKMAAEALSLMRTDWMLHGRIYYRLRALSATHMRLVAFCFFFLSSGNVLNIDSKHGSWSREWKYFQLSPLLTSVLSSPRVLLFAFIYLSRICRQRSGVYFDSEHACWAWHRGFLRSMFLTWTSSSWKKKINSPWLHSCGDSRAPRVFACRVVVCVAALADIDGTLVVALSCRRVDVKYARCYAESCQELTCITWLGLNALASRVYLLYLCPRTLCSLGFIYLDCLRSALIVCLTAGPHFLPTFQCKNTLFPWYNPWVVVETAARLLNNLYSVCVRNLLSVLCFPLEIRVTLQMHQLLLPGSFL